MSIPAAHIQLNSVGMRLTRPLVDWFSLRMTNHGRRAFMEGFLIAAATGMFAAYLCFVWPSLLESCDYIVMWKPFWHFLRDAVGQGTVPLWNPYIGLGRPYLADMQTAVFYPPLYLVLLGENIGVFLLVWLHCLVAVYGTKRLATSLNIGRAQGNFMAFCFIGSGALVARWTMGQLPYCWALCYTPWLFYFAAGTGGRWNPRSIAAHALFLAAQFLCGNPQVFWFSIIGQGVFILGRSFKLPLRDGLRESCRSLCQFGAALLLCAGLSTAILLPFAELVGQGNRNMPSPALANFLKLDWWHFASLVEPVGVLSQNPTHQFEMNLFVGWAVLVLGLRGLCFVREANVRGLLAMSFVAFLIAMGNSTPAFYFFYHWVPGFASLRAHSRAAFLIVFALICGTGICLSRPNPGLLIFWKRHVKLSTAFLFAGLVLFQICDIVRAGQEMKTAYTFGNLFQVSPNFPFRRVLVGKLKSAGLLEAGQPPPRVCVPTGLVFPNDAMIYRYSTFDEVFSLFLRRDWDYLHRTLGVKPSEVVNTSISDQAYRNGPFPYADLSLSAGFDPPQSLRC